MSSPANPIECSSSIFAESTRIVKDKQCHFLSLSFLFFFPPFISVFTIVNFILSQSNAVSLNPLSFLLSHYLTSKYWIALTILYALLVLSLFVAGVATITYSTQQGLYGKPLNLSSTIKSLSKSFFPLISTTLTSVACLLFACIVFLLFCISLLNSLQTQGIQINFSFKFRVVTFAIVTGLLLISFHMILILAGIITVVESKWGFEPLRRSFFLVRGMKQSSLSILLLRGVSIWVLLIGYSALYLTNPGPWDFRKVLQSSGISIFWMIFLSPFVSAYTILYLNCKDLHEESGFDIAVEISKYCVNLVIDDNKLVHESSVKLLATAAASMVVLLTLAVVTS